MPISPEASSRDAERSILCPGYTASPTEVAYTGTAARNGTDLAEGLHVIISTTACHFLQGDSSVTADANDHYLPAGVQRLVSVTGSANARISAIRASVSGTLQIHPL